MDNTEYELMELLYIDGDNSGSHEMTNPNVRYPNGIDSDPCMTGDAMAVVKYLIKNDDRLSKYKLVKRAKNK